MQICLYDIVVRLTSIIKIDFIFIYQARRAKVAGIHNTTRKAVYFAGEVMFKYHVVFLPVNGDRLYTRMYRFGRDAVKKGLHLLNRF